MINPYKKLEKIEEGRGENCCGEFYFYPLKGDFKKGIDFADWGHLTNTSEEINTVVNRWRHLNTPLERKIDKLVRQVRSKKDLNAILMGLNYKDWFFKIKKFKSELKSLEKENEFYENILSFLQKDVFPQYEKLYDDYYYYGQEEIFYDFKTDFVETFITIKNSIPVNEEIKERFFALFKEKEKDFSSFLSFLQKEAKEALENFLKRKEYKEEYLFYQKIDPEKKEKLYALIGDKFLTDIKKEIEKKFEQNEILIKRHQLYLSSKDDDLQEVKETIKNNYKHNKLFTETIRLTRKKKDRKDIPKIQEPELLEVIEEECPEFYKLLKEKMAFLAEAYPDVYFFEDYGENFAWERRTQTEFVVGEREEEIKKTVNFILEELYKEYKEKVLPKISRFIEDFDGYLAPPYFKDEKRRDYKKDYGWQRIMAIFGEGLIVSPTYFSQRLEGGVAFLLALDDSIQDINMDEIKRGEICSGECERTICHSGIKNKEGEEYIPLKYVKGIVLLRLSKEENEKIVKKLKEVFAEYPQNAVPIYSFSGKLVWPEEKNKDKN